MPQSRNKLVKAKKKKDDEFYTKYNDISKELVNYKDQLKGKSILCPCDWDEGISKDNCNFAKFLNAVKDDWGIKKVSWSGYNPNDSKNTKGLKNFIRFQDVDFKKYDVIITNPPFSQFREFIKQLIDSKVKFLVIGSLGACTYNKVFEYIQNNKLWLGYTSPKEFKGLDGTIKTVGTFWYTNLKVSYRNDIMILTETYNKDKYKKYENYNGINIDRVRNIPCDYKGVMGVPLRILQKYNPRQFKIIGLSSLVKHTIKVKTIQLKGKLKGCITTNCKGNIFFKTTKEKGNYKHIEKDIYYKSPFGRILIKNLKK